MGVDEVLPTGVLAGVWCWRDAVTFQNVFRSSDPKPDGRDWRGPGNAIVTPARVLLGHAKDHRFEFVAHARTPRVGTMLRPSNLRAISRRYQARMVSGFA